MSGPYDNIINLPHPTSKRHPRMSLHDRAAQFSPFAALSGHAAALAETTRLTDRKIELDEDTRAELDRRQAVLLEQISEQPEITVTWFQPDGKKEGGRYITATGRLKKAGRGGTGTGPHGWDEHPLGGCAGTSERLLPQHSSRWIGPASADRSK
ncbi:MAG: hypothetical protein ACLSHO_00720 [Dysosmobacter sp.]